MVATQEKTWTDAEIIPCPFGCVGPRAPFRFVVRTPGKVFAVQCCDCMAAGPPAESEQQAVDLWNRRARS